MAQSLPWSVKGLDPDTRDAVREAARRAGMSVSEWLEHLIRQEAVRQDTARSEPVRAHSRLTPEDEADADEEVGRLQARLRRLGQSGSHDALGRGSQRAASQQVSGRELDALIGQAAQIEARTRQAESKTTSALESIVGWIEKAESRMAAAERAAAERQERATSVIADAIKTVSSRVADVERRARTDSAPSQPVETLERGAIQRRPVLSRASLSGAISDIQMRRRELEEPDARPRAGAPIDLRARAVDADRAPLVERRLGERRADVTPIMNSLRDDLAQLRGDIASLTMAPASTRLEDSIRELAQRLDQRPASASSDELARPLARIEAELSRLQNQDTGPHFGRIEQELGRLGSRIESLAAASTEPRVLAAAVHELGTLKDALVRHSQAPRLDDLSGQIATLSKDMARLREEIGRSGSVGEVETALEEMRDLLVRETRQTTGIGHGLLQRIIQQVEGVSAAISQVGPGGLGEQDRAQLSLLSHKLDQLASRTQPESEDLARRIEALSEKLDDISGERSGALLERVERLSQQIELMATRGPAAIESQIDMLAARIETLARSQPAAQSVEATVDLRPIEDMIGDLARKLDDVSRTDDSSQGLAALERQIAALANRLDTRPTLPERADGLENTLQDLMRSLGGLREETASAVDRAARAAVADAIARVPQAPMQSPAGLADLRDDLAGLRDVHASIDQRTHSAIGAVNDTLQKIVDRLALLEDGISRERVELSASRNPPLPGRDNLANDSLTGNELSETPSRMTAARQTVQVAVPAAAASDAPRSTLRDIAMAREAARHGTLSSARPAMPRVNLPDLPDLSPLSALEPKAAPTAVSVPPMAPEPTSAQTRRLGQPVDGLSDDLSTDLLPESAPDLPLEPGSGRPRARAEATNASGAINPNLIAAARRAAMAASAEADALKGDAGKAPAKSKTGRLQLPISLKETLEKRRKPILLGLAAIILALGASHVATTLLDDAPAIEQGQVAPKREPAAQPDASVQGSRAAPAVSETERRESVAPAPAATPARDQSTMAPPASNAVQVPIQAAESTASVKPVEVAALSPANAPLDSRSFSTAPGRVSNLGELAPGLGTPGLRAAALAGDPNAVYELGTRAADGVGMARDQKLAFRLFERAAAAGFAPAQFRLANMHEKGLGTARDANLAITWYRRAAEKGNAKAMHNLAVLLAEGADGRPDYGTAADLFRKAAEFGVRDSQYNLAILLGRGLGAEQDLAQSFVWFAVAARQGDTDAAKKRDEVGAKLTGADLAAARMAAQAWKPRMADPISNEASAPAEGWDPQPKRQPPARPRTS